MILIDSNWHELGALIHLYCPLLVPLIMCNGGKMRVDAWKDELMSTSCFPHLQTESQQLIHDGV